MNDVTPAFFYEPSERLAYGVLPRSQGFWAVAAYMTLYVVRPWEVLVPELSDYGFERIAYAAILLIVIASTGLRLRFNNPTVGVFAFVAALFVTAVTARDPELAWGAFYVYLTNLFALLIMVSVVRSPYELYFLVVMAVFSISLYAGKSLWEYTVNGAGIFSMGVVRLRGVNETFGHANAVATILVSTLPWWVFLARCRPSVERDWPPWWKPYFRVFLVVVPILFLACIVLSGSRAGAAGLVLFGFLSVAAAGRNRARNFLAVIVVGLVTWSMLGDANKQRIRSTWDSSAAVGGGEGSKRGRIEGFRAGLAMLNEFPITGVGIGNFGDYRRKHVDGSYLEAHNIPGELLGETGVLGTAAFVFMLSMILMATRSMNRMAEYCPDPTTETFSALAVAVRHTIYLMLFLGLADHLSYRFTWIWLAAFCSCALWLGSVHLSHPHVHHAYGGRSGEELMEQLA